MSRRFVSNGRGELLAVLKEARALLALPENDFAWSSWEGTDDALREIDGLIATIEGGHLPEQLSIAVLFAPTGPIQEVSLSSGWSQEFLEVADRFDAAEKTAYLKWWPFG